MKKNTRILSAALVAMMVLSLAVVASAETPSVYIPNRLAKLVDAVVDDYVYPELVTKGDIVTKYDKVTGKEIAWNLNTEGVMHFQFSEKPDYAGAIVSSLDGGWINLDVDDSGYAEMELEDLVRQPGTWSWSNVYFVDKDGVWHSTGRSPSNPDIVEKWFKGEGYADFVKTPAKKTNEDGSYYVLMYGNGGDYAYQAGKDYGDYSVVVSYHRDGSPYEVAVSLKDTDLFETGMEGAVSTITFKVVNVELDSYKRLYQFIYGDDSLTTIKVRPNNKFVTTKKDADGNITQIYYEVPGRRDINPSAWDTEIFDLSNTDVWYVAAVSATYPAGNFIVGAEADFRNDKKNNLSQYKISYAVNDTDVARITYNPYDAPVFGEYLKDGDLYAVSGSGNNLNKWYRNYGSSVETIPVYEYDAATKTYKIVDTYTGKLQKNGKKVGTIKKGIKSYPSPRVTTK